MTMLKIERLNAYYGKLHVLFNVSLDVDKEEIVSVLGPNGAGKTTLLKSIINVEVTKSGKIMFENIDITSLPPIRLLVLVFIISQTTVAYYQD
jgi:branched-chain amino acid transport system ATP-binding protein